MGPADHVIAFVLVIVVPLHGWRAWRRLGHALARGRVDARLEAYARTILMEWSLVAAVLFVWIALGRSLQSLGLAVSRDGPFMLTLVTALVLGALLLNQIRAIRNLDAERIAAIQRQLASVEKLLPHTAAERDAFLGVALTAGVCEELLYRGFLIGYLTPFTGIWGAVLAAAAVFGVGHAYQGRAGILKTGTIGLVMGAIYALSGSIWPAIVLHAAFDVQGGLIGYTVLSRVPAASGAAD